MSGWPAFLPAALLLRPSLRSHNHGPSRKSAVFLDAEDKTSSTSKKRPVFLEVKDKRTATSKNQGIFLEVAQMDKHKIYEEGF